MQHDVEQRTEVNGSLRASGDREDGDRETMTEEERLESLRYEEILANINRDHTMSVVPPSFILHETPKEHTERLELVRAGLAALRTGDPEEHRETLEALLAALDDVHSSCEREPSSE
jgi:hypothetical protein